MPWVEARFKGKPVWIEVDDTGQPVVKKGLVPMRYAARAGAKVYSGGVANITRVDGAQPVELGAGGARGGSSAAALGPPPEGAIVAYTDGACRGNPGPAGSGVFMTFPDGRTVEVSESLGHATNNVGELRALGVALELLDEAEVAADHPVRLYTDSTYAIGVLTKGWKAKKNPELIADIKHALSQRSGVELAWVKGHAGIAGNERADQLAVSGSRGIDSKRWGQIGV